MLYAIIFWGASIFLCLAILTIGWFSLEKLGVVKPPEEDDNGPMTWGEIGLGSTLFLTVPLLLIFWAHDKGKSPYSISESVITYLNGRSFSEKSINYFKNDIKLVVSALGSEGYPTKSDLEVSNGFIIFSGYPAIQISNWHSPNSNCIGGEPEKDYQYLDKLLLCRALKDFTAVERWSMLGYEMIEFKKGEIYLEKLYKDQRSHYAILPSKA